MMMSQDKNPYLLTQHHLAYPHSLPHAASMVPRPGAEGLCLSDCHYKSWIQAVTLQWLI